MNPYRDTDISDEALIALAERSQKVAERALDGHDKTNQYAKRLDRALKKEKGFTRRLGILLWVMYLALFVMSQSMLQTESTHEAELARCGENVTSAD